MELRFKNNINQFNTILTLANKKDLIDFFLLHLFHEIMQDDFNPFNYTTIFIISKDIPVIERIIEKNAILH